MKHHKRLSALQQLTAAKLMSAQSDMQSLALKEGDLRKNLATLAVKKRESTQLQASADPASIAGANLRWQKWADEKRDVINSELATVLAQKINTNAILKRAFGKDQALIALIKKQQCNLRK